MSSKPHPGLLASFTTVAMALLTIFVAPRVQAQAIHTCIDARGAVSYQNAACPLGQKTRSIKPYQDVVIDPTLSARSQAIQQEMDRRNRVDRHAVRSLAVRAKARAKPDPCRAAKARRDTTLKRVGLKRNFDLLSRLDNDVWDVCKGF